MSCSAPKPYAPVPWSLNPFPALQNKSGVLFASNSQFEMGKTIVHPIGSKHLGILKIWGSFCCQPFVENISSQKHSENKTQTKYIITFSFSEFCARPKFNTEDSLQIEHGFS